MRIKTLLVASFLICTGSIAHADPYLLYTNGTASGLENQGTTPVFGSFSGAIYVDPSTSNVMSGNIVFSFSSGTTYTFKDSAIPALSALPTPTLPITFTDYSFVQNGTTFIQIVDPLGPPTTAVLDFSFADLSTALRMTGEPINSGAQIVVAGSTQAPTK